MKLKTRLVIAFFTIIIIPVLMAAMMVSMVCRYQIGVVEKNYGITGTTISDFTIPCRYLHVLRRSRIMN